MRRRGPRSRRGQRRRSSPYAPRTRQRPSWSAIERRVRNRTCHHRSKCTYVGTLAQRHASPGQDTRVGRRTKVAPLKKVTQCCVGKNNLVDSGSGFKNAHRRRARRSSLWPPMPPQSMLRSRKRIVFFKNGRLFFPRVRHSSWQLPTLNKGARGVAGVQNFAGRAFIYPEPVSKRCGKLVTPNAKMRSASGLHAFQARGQLCWWARSGTARDQL